MHGNVSTDDLSQALGLSDLTFIGPALPEAAAPSFSRIYAFGDSLSDAGNATILTAGAVPVSPPYFPGHFSNGPTWVEDLAGYLGLPALRPSLAGGTDFAVGDSTTGGSGAHTANPTDLPGQAVTFALLNPNPAPNALYTVWAGSNDVSAVLQQGNIPPAQAGFEIATAVANEIAIVNYLADHGAKDFVVVNVPDLGRTPGLAALGPTAQRAASFLSALFDAELQYGIQPLVSSGKIKLDLVDTFGLVDGVIANPGPFGFTNVTTPVWSGDSESRAGSLATTDPAAQNQHLFWDSIHPTASAHALLGGYVAQTVAQAFG